MGSDTIKSPNMLCNVNHLTSAGSGTATTTFGYDHENSRVMHLAVRFVTTAMTRRHQTIPSASPQTPPLME